MHKNIAFVMPLRSISKIFIITNDLEVLKIITTPDTEFTEIKTGALFAIQYPIH